MTLDEIVDRLPKPHGARTELSNLRAALWAHKEAICDMWANVSGLVGIEQPKRLMLYALNQRGIDPDALISELAVHAWDGQDHEFVGHDADCLLCGEGGQFYAHLDRDTSHEEVE